MLSQLRKLLYFLYYMHYCFLLYYYKRIWCVVSRRLLQCTQGLFLLNKNKTDQNIQLIRAFGFPSAALNEIYHLSCMLVNDITVTLRKKWCRRQLVQFGSVKHCLFQVLFLCMRSQAVSTGIALKKDTTSYETMVSSSVNLWIKCWELVTQHLLLSCRGSEDAARNWKVL